MNTMELLKPYEAQMIADRRWMHEHPELSGQEEQTLEYIISALRALGLGVHVVPDGGAIGVLGDEGAHPCVLLRADVDALPICEIEENLAGAKSCTSKYPGVMHACGHDAHAAMLLGAARALAAKREEIAGCVLFVFEQGEERGGKGCLENLLPYIDEHFDVDACYGTHVRWDIPAGKIAVLDGMAMAGGFGFDVTIRGKGGHGSRPDLANSPIDCFCAIHQQLSSLRMRAIAPDQMLTYSLGCVQSGDQSNIIPETLRFSGTVRTGDTAGAGDAFAAQVRRVIDHTCGMHGCSAEYTHFSKPLYEVRNHVIAAERMRQAIAESIGRDYLTDCQPWMASETMGAYLRLWPGVLTFTGIQNEVLGTGANHHTPRFDVDEAALLPGAAAACAYALDMLVNCPDFGFKREIVSMQDLVSRSI